MHTIILYWKSLLEIICNLRDVLCINLYINSRAVEFWVSVVTHYELHAALCARVWSRLLNGAAEEEEEDGNMYKVRNKLQPILQCVFVTYTLIMRTTVRYSLLNSHVLWVQLSSVHYKDDHLIFFSFKEAFEDMIQGHSKTKWTILLV